MAGSTTPTRRPSPPPPLKQWIDRRLVPAAIDMAALVESAVELVAVQTRARPHAALLGAAGLGALLCRLAVRRSR